MTTITDTPTPAESYAARVRENINEALDFYRLTSKEVADALDRNLESIRRKRRGDNPWSVAELGALADLIRTRPGGDAFDAIEFHRPRP